MTGALLYARAMLAEAGGGAEAMRAPLTPRERSLLETCATAHFHDICCINFSNSRLSQCQALKKTSKSASLGAIVAPKSSHPINFVLRLIHCMLPWLSPKCTHWVSVLPVQACSAAAGTAGLAHTKGGCIGWQDIVLALGGACMKGRADSARRCVPSAGMRHSGRLHWRRGKPSWRPHRAAAALPAPAATLGSCCSCGWPRLCTRWEHVCQWHSLASARSVPTLFLCVESSHSLDCWQASCHKAPFTHWLAAASGSSEKTNVLRVNTRSRRRETWPPALRGRARLRTRSAPARRQRWSAYGTQILGSGLHPKLLNRNPQSP